MMAAVEPNWVALLLFCLVWGACCLAFLTLVGMFPMRARPDATRGAKGAALIVSNLLLLGALLVGTALFAEVRLRWTSVVVAGGLVFLFVPTVFEVWPRHRRDSRAGLLVLAGLQLATMVVLLLAGMIPIQTA